MKFITICIILLFIPGCGPDRSEYFYKKGVKDFYNQKYKGAIKNFSNTIKINPKHTKAYMYTNSTFLLL